MKKIKKKNDVKISINPIFKKLLTTHKKLYGLD